MEAFRYYMNSHGYNDKTVDSYIRSIDRFIVETVDPIHFGYKQVLEYMVKIKNRYPSSATPNKILASLKKYYDYLIENGVRDNHPCRNLQIKIKRDNMVLQSDLFTEEDLELLMEREERYENQAIKNKLLTSLLIYQGLTAREITELNITNIDLDEGEIYIKPSSKLASRRLPIKSYQYSLFYKYLDEIRLKAKQKGFNPDTKRLILNKAGNPIKYDDIKTLLLPSKELFLDKELTASTIRQSVISNWLNVKKIPLEQVQLMAGHKWISTTIKYRQNDNEKRREMINRFFPE